MSVDLVQGSPEWLRARSGSLGASQIADVMAKTRTGVSASRANLLATLVIERLTGKPKPTYTNAAMARGTQLEPDARDLYAFMVDVPVVQVGLVPHPTIARSHASPDGLVGCSGLVEIKCPGESAHLATLMSSKMDRAYYFQAAWQMACTGRQWVDLVSYHPEFPAELQLYVERFRRDDAMIAELETAARVFLAEVEATVAELRRKFKLAA